PPRWWPRLLRSSSRPQLIHDVLHGFAKLSERERAPCPVRALPQLGERTDKTRAGMRALRQHVVAGLRQQVDRGVFLRQISPCALDLLRDGAGLGVVHCTRFSGEGLPAFLGSTLSHVSESRSSTHRSPPLNCTAWALNSPANSA